MGVSRVPLARRYHGDRDTGDTTDGGVTMATRVGDVRGRQNVTDVLRKDPRRVWLFYAEGVAVWIHRLKFPQGVYSVPKPSVSIATFWHD